MTSSCHAFFGSFVLRDCTLLLKLSMALCARETVELEPDPIEAPPLPTPPLPPWAGPSGGAVGGFERGLRTLPLLCTLEPMLLVSGEASLKRKVV